VKKYGLAKFIPVFGEHNFYVSTKGSPSGPATLSAGISASSLTEAQKEDIRIIAGDEILPYIEKHVKATVDYKPEKGINGKLSLVEDPEGKIRVIAMLDYYSQVVLKPIHDDLLLLLKKFPMDRTYDQNP
jgi:hypothetical protein